MYRNHLIAVVVPAYNVAERIASTIHSVPEYVDFIVVVDDASTDETLARMKNLSCPRLTILRHNRNGGVGAAIATGYAEALRLGAEVLVVMAGDGQMDPEDLPRLLNPVVEGRADYAKGNRFSHPDIWRVMPKARLMGNFILSLLTKLTSGYWHLFDSQSGYTAISRHALIAIQGRLFARYGYPNDLLARLRVVNARVIDVKIRPIYDGQSSGIRFWTFFYPVLFVLFCSMCRRIWQQYGQVRQVKPQALAFGSVTSSTGLQPLSCDIPIGTLAKPDAADKKELIHHGQISGISTSHPINFQTYPPASPITAESHTVH